MSLPFDGLRAVSKVEWSNLSPLPPEADLPIADKLTLLCPERSRRMNLIKITETHLGQTFGITSIHFFLNYFLPYPSSPDLSVKF